MYDRRGSLIEYIYSGLSFCSLVSTLYADTEEEVVVLEGVTIVRAVVVVVVVVTEAMVVVGTSIVGEEAATGGIDPAYLTNMETYNYNQRVISLF